MRDWQCFLTHSIVRCESDFISMRNNQYSILICEYNLFGSANRKKNIHLQLSKYIKSFPSCCIFSGLDPLVPCFMYCFCVHNIVSILIDLRPTLYVPLSRCNQFAHWIFDRCINWDSEGFFLCRLFFFVRSLYQFFTRYNVFFVVVSIAMLLGI